MALPVQAAKAAHGRPTPRPTTAVPRAPARNTSAHKALPLTVLHQRLQAQAEAAPTTAAQIAAARRVAITIAAAALLREIPRRAVATTAAAHPQAQAAAQATATAEAAAAQAQAAATAQEAEEVAAQAEAEEDNSATRAIR